VSSPTDSLSVMVLCFLSGVVDTVATGDVSMFPLSDTTGLVVVKVKSVLQRLYYMHKPKTNMSWVSSYYIPP
jgi:hypothetical protein